LPRRPLTADANPTSTTDADTRPDVRPGPDPGGVVISIFANERNNLPRRLEGPWDQIVESLGEHVSTECTLATCARSECPHKKILFKQRQKLTMGLPERRAAA